MDPPVFHLFHLTTLLIDLKLSTQLNLIKREVFVQERVVGIIGKMEEFIRENKTVKL